MADTPIQLVPAVDRAIRMLIDLRGERDGKGISALSRDLDIPKSSAYQIATTMVFHGMLECDATTRRYRLGPALQTVVGAQAARPGIVVLAIPHLQSLSERTGLTALLGVPTAGGVVLAAKADSPRPLGVGAPVGFVLDRMAGAFGKVFAAALDERQRKELLRSALPRFTKRSIVDAGAMERELARVRRNGVATDVEEYLEGIRAAAAPVVDAQGSTVGALCVLGVAARLKGDQLAAAADEVRRAAAALTRDIGGMAPDEEAA